MCLHAFGIIPLKDFGGLFHWVADFSHYEVGGDALLVELRAIRMELEFCRNKIITL
jgi:hypothetical protein